MSSKSVKRSTIVYVGFAFMHHKAGHGGYHHIADSGQYDYIIDCQSNYERQFSQKWGYLSKYWHLLMRKIFAFDAFPFFVFRCLIYAITHRYVVFHLIYGENLYIPLFRIIRPFAKVVCTFHQPYEKFEDVSWQKRLSRLDGVILVSDTEIEQFKTAVIKGFVSYVPHGVYTDFFHPIPTIKKEKILLTVGNWLRDYHFANQVYKLFLQAHDDWSVHVVANDTCLKQIDDDERIHKHTGITDEELLELYCCSSVLFLPLKRYTANNAVLEAAACGCNILIACNHIENSYLPKELYSESKIDKKEVLYKLSFHKDFNYNQKLVEFVEKNYSWNAVAQKTISIIETV